MSTRPENQGPHPTNGCGPCWCQLLVPTGTGGLERRTQAAYRAAHQRGEVETPLERLDDRGRLVLLADRLDEADRLERAVLRGLDELRLVLQMVLARLGSGCVVGKVVERLMVELEIHIGAVGKERVGIMLGIRADRSRAVGPAR